MSKESITKAVDSADVVAEFDATEKFEYVEVPDKDIFGHKFSGVGINAEHYGPGTHKVHPDIAAEIKRILNRAAAQDVRIISPRQDSAALQALLANAAARGIGFTK